MPLEHALRRQGLLARTNWVTKWDVGAELDQRARDTYYSPLLVHPHDSKQTLLVGPQSDAEISLSLKHLEALRSIATSHHPFGVVVEDDVQFLEFVRERGGGENGGGDGDDDGEHTGSFSASVCRRVSQIDAHLGGWDVLCLGSEIEGTQCNALPECRGRPAAARRAGVFRKARGAGVPLFKVGAQNLMRLSGAHAVSRGAARWLADALVPFSLPIDAQLNWILNLRGGGGKGEDKGAAGQKAARVWWADPPLTRQGTKLKSPSALPSRVQRIQGTSTSEEAEYAYRTSIRLRPSTLHAASSHMFLGNRLYNRGEIAAAAESWRAALRVAPTLSAAAHNLRMAQTKLKSQRSDDVNMAEAQSASEVMQKKAKRKGNTKHGNPNDKGTRKMNRKKRKSARRGQKLTAKAKQCDVKNRKRKRRRRRKKKKKTMKKKTPATTKRKMAESSGAH